MRSKKRMSRKARHSMIEKAERAPAGMCGNDQSVTMKATLEERIKELDIPKQKATKNTNKRRRRNTKRQYKRK